MGRFARDAVFAPGIDISHPRQTFEAFKETLEKLFLQQRLTESDWNVKRTAERLGMQRLNLHRKIKRHDSR